jgi:hypothetical protein
MGLAIKQYSQGEIEIDVEFANLNFSLPEL